MDKETEKLLHNLLDEIPEGEMTDEIRQQRMQFLPTLLDLLEALEGEVN